MKRKLVITVRAAPLDGRKAILTVGHLNFPAAIGRGGIRAIKREGDGGTPLARMKMLYGYGRRDRGPLAASALPMRNTRPGDLWCDAPAHALYNRPARKPFRPSHEEMHRTDGLYDLCIVLDWNMTSRRRNAGSAIFFHLIRGDYEPTAGCVALSRRDMIRLLPLLSRNAEIRVLK